jgi:hypothetical protein
MKHVFLAAAAAFAVAAGSAYAQPNPPEPERPGFSNSARSATQLKSLLEDWDRAGFTAPSKPSQYRVYGRDGHMADGPGYNAMVSLIRTAMRDSRLGHEREALIAIARAQTLLGRGTAG